MRYPGENVFSGRNLDTCLWILEKYGLELEVSELIA